MAPSNLVPKVAAKSEIRGRSRSSDFIAALPALRRSRNPIRTRLKPLRCQARNVDCHCRSGLVSTEILLEEVRTSTHRVARLLTLIAALACGPAMAYPENPFLTPEHPTAGESIVFNVHSGPCDLLQHPFEVPIVTLVDDKVAVQLSGEHITDPEWCVGGSRIEGVNIGAFPPGSYMVSVDWRYYDGFGFVHIALGVLPLTIAAPVGSDPKPLPTSSGFGMAALAFLLVAAAGSRLRFGDTA